MEVYLPQANYIKREETEYGVGLLMSTSEERAKVMTARKKNLASYNQWLRAEVPDESLFMRMDISITEQSQSIIDGLHEETFLFTLYLHDAQNAYNKVSEEVLGLSNEDAKRIVKARMSELATIKFEKISCLTGLELIQLVNSRCRGHDMAKSSALLYDAGIRGTVIPGTDGQDFLIFNPHADMCNVVPRNAILPNGKLVF